MKILLGDNHALMRDALVRRVLALGPDIEACEAADFESTRRVLEGDVDVAIVDLDLPGMQGFQGLARLRRDFPSLTVVVMSARQNPATLREVLACDVSGVIPKTEPGDVVVRALRLVLAGGIYVPLQILGGARSDRIRSRPSAPQLTQRQGHVLARMLDGRSNKLIARDLALAEGTVKIHVAAILRELGVRSRTEAVVRAWALGLHLDDGGRHPERPPEARLA